MSEIEVFTQENFAMGGVDIYITLRRGGTERSIMHVNASRTSWDEHEQLTVAEPTLRLPFEAGPLLLSALVRLYNGADDTRALRQDYDSERQRVDKLTDAIIGIAAGRSPA